MMENKTILNDDDLSKVSGGYGSNFAWPGASDILYVYIPWMESIRLNLTDDVGRQLEYCENLLRRIAYSTSYQERIDLACDFNYAIGSGAVSEYREELGSMVTKIFNLIRAFQ